MSFICHLKTAKMQCKLKDGLFLRVASCVQDRPERIMNATTSEEMAESSRTKRAVTKRKRIGEGKILETITTVSNAEEYKYAQQCPSACCTFFLLESFSLSFFLKNYVNIPFNSSLFIMKNELGPTECLFSLIRPNNLPFHPSYLFTFQISHVD